MRYDRLTPGEDCLDFFVRKRAGIDCQAMPAKRGDVVLTYVENVVGPGGVVRPALVVQADQNNARLNETIIAAIASKVWRTWKRSRRQGD